MNATVAPSPSEAPRGTPLRSRPEPRLRLRDNPLLVAQARRRLRLRQTLPGVLIVVVLGFCGVLLALTQREREAWAGLAWFSLVLTGLALFLRAPLRLAGLVSEERQAGLLDFHRATPTSAWTDAVGYLLGIPAREYLLAAVTLPFLILGTLLAGFSLPAVLGVFAVFLLSGLLYHAFALLAGLSLERRWSAVGVAILGVVGVLTAWLPFVRSGLTAFAYLTPFPVMGELLVEGGPFGDVGTDVTFFGLELPATVFTVLVQGWLLAFLLVASVRKVRRADATLLSRPGAFLFLATALAIAAGSAWSVPGEWAEELLWPVAAAQVGVTFLVLGGATAALLLGALVPSYLERVRAQRRARKAGRRRVHWLQDGASVLPLPLAFGALLFGGLLLVVASTPADLRLPLTAWAVVAVATETLALGFAGCLGEYVRLVHRRSARAQTLLWGFLTVVLPWILSGIVAAGSGGHRFALWFAAPSPLYAVAHALVHAGASWSSGSALVSAWGAGPFVLSLAATAAYAGAFFALAARASARATADRPQASAAPTT